VLLTGVALGEVMAASVGEVMAASEEMGVELESSSLTCWSTMARARSIVGVTGASCSLPLPRLLLLCSDIVMLSERGWEELVGKGKEWCRGGGGGGDGGGV
jgi:hypothetical protein